MCHVYVRADGLAGVVISDHEYPSRVSHTLITRILDEFTQKIPAVSWPSLEEREISFPQLNVHLAKYQNPKEADAMTKIQEDLDETKIILVCFSLIQSHDKLRLLNIYNLLCLTKIIIAICVLYKLFFYQHNTIEAVLQRGEKLDDLVIKSEGLSMQSKAFYKTARKTNSCCSFS